MTRGWSAQRLDRFVLLYALAFAGGTIGYTPLLTILLPVRIADLAGKQAGVDWLAYIALAGAIAASLGGIIFGYLSDITRNRRGWIAVGLALSCLLLVCIGQVTSLPHVIAMVVCWQLALNMMLGPLAALAGDAVPDDRKGMLGGLMAFAPGMGALAGALVTHPGLVADGLRLVFVAAIVMACVSPLLILGSRMPAAGQAPGPPALQPDMAQPRTSPFVRMWLARLFIQIAEATLFAYLYFWLTDLDPAISDNQTARLFGAIMLISAPIALIVGRWSDRTGRPMMPLVACTSVSALGLGTMALSRDIAMAVPAYALFGVSSAVFLALHSAQTLRILPRPDRRGRDLGLFNLANTVPSLVMPWLAITIIPLSGFSGLFIILTALSALSGLLLSPLVRGK